MPQPQRRTFDPRTALTLMAPRDPALRLAYLNGCLNVLDHLRHVPRTIADQADFNARRREVLDARQELLDTARPARRTLTTQEAI